MNEELHKWLLSLGFAALTLVGVAVFASVMLFVIVPILRYLERIVFSSVTSMIVTGVVVVLLILTVHIRFDSAFWD